MFTQSQRSRIARACASATIKAMAAFPEMLAQCEPEQAAHIVADVIKAHLAGPDPRDSPEPAASYLDGLIAGLTEVQAAQADQSGSVQTPPDPALP